MNSNDLSEKTVNAIYQSSPSIINFATKLMVHLFTEAEMIQSSNVYGRKCFQVPTTSCEDIGPALDPERVETIRRLVEEKAGSSEKVWRSCVTGMNIKIWKVKKLVLRDNR